MRARFLTGQVLKDIADGKCINELQKIAQEKNIPLSETNEIIKTEPRLASCNSFILFQHIRTHAKVEENTSNANKPKKP